MIDIGSDFSGVGAFDQALIRLGINYKTIFACDMDKYARQTYIENYGEPSYYPKNVYNREIPKKSLDIYMTSPPCQSFSLAGKRKGEDSVNGVLFYNSHEFIQENKPRFFIFENVKGLLSDAKGRTFQIWLDMLGGKSVNGNPVIFPREDATPYHIYHQVLNAKNYGVPQNRERVFIIGIRDDCDNNFHFPKEQYLVKRLKDFLEDNVDEKYYLSDKMINSFINRPQAVNFPFNPLTEESNHSPCLTARYFKMGATDPYIQVKSATKKGYEVATENDSINLSQPNSETRRGRVGKGVAQTLDTACNQAVIINKNECDKIIQLNNPKHSNNRIYSAEGLSPTLNTMQGGNRQPFVKQINPSKESGGVQPYQQNRIFEGDISNTLDTACGKPSYVTSNKIRRLTPRECFRLMDFPNTFKMPCSNSQMYKQAGNSIVVNVLAEIINKLKL
jgi:DNA (cytosine-5)-methyltransferase 1